MKNIILNYSPLYDIELRSDSTFATENSLTATKIYGDVKYVSSMTFYSANEQVLHKIIVLPSINCKLTVKTMIMHILILLEFKYFS